MKSRFATVASESFCNLWNKGCKMRKLFSRVMLNLIWLSCFVTPGFSMHIRYHETQRTVLTTCRSQQGGTGSKCSDCRWPFIFLMCGQAHVAKHACLPPRVQQVFIKSWQLIICHCNPEEACFMIDKSDHVPWHWSYCHCLLDMIYTVSSNVRQTLSKHIYISDA